MTPLGNKLNLNLRKKQVGDVFTGCSESRKLIFRYDVYLSLTFTHRQYLCIVHPGLYRTQRVQFLGHEDMMQSKVNDTTTCISVDLVLMVHFHRAADDRDRVVQLPSKLRQLLPHHTQGVELTITGIIICVSAETSWELYRSWLPIYAVTLAARCFKSMLVDSLIFVCNYIH